MSDEQVVEMEGITVTKSFDAEGFPVPTVTFEVDSDRSDAVELRILDEVPEGFAIEQIGFHPDYGSEHWSATSEGIVRFERTVNAGETFTTVYGIRMGDDDEPDPFLGAPEIEVNPTEIDEGEFDDVVSRESSEVVRELASGERDTIPGLEEEDESPSKAEAESKPQTGTETLADDDAEIIGAGETADQDDADSTDAADAEIGAEVERTESDVSEDTVAEEVGAEVREEQDDPEVQEAEPEEPVEAQAPAEEGQAEPTGTKPEPTAAPHTSHDQDEQEGGPRTEVESIASALATEIREGNVDDDDLDEIRNAITEEPTPSDKVRVEHLQSRVSDLEAYTDALESFIDEEGEAQELLENLESQIQSFESELDEAASERKALEDRFDTIFENLTDLSEQIDRLESDVDALDERVDDAESARFEVEALEDSVKSLREEVEEVKQWRDQLSNVFGGS